MVTTAYGRAAAVALHAEIARVKREDPLAPVTVIVPTNSVSVAARRLLASGELGPCSRAGLGIVGAQFLTVLRLAELLGSARLAASGRRPVSTPVVAAAVRAVLAQHPGVFRPVAEHPATEEAIVAAHRELSDIADAGLQVLARQSPRAREVVRIHRAVTERLAADWYSEHDLMVSAIDVVGVGSPLVDQLGTVVVYLPQRLTGPATRLVRGLAERLDVTVVAGLTGDARADEQVVVTVAALDAKVDDAAFALAPMPGTTRAISVSDPDDEARAVVRELVDAMRAGVPLERMAVLFAASEPYARLLHEHLELAGIVHNGAAVRTLRESVPGQALTRLLALADGGFRRDDLLGLLAGAPVVGADDAWERISRVAGVVRGLPQWRARLADYAASLGTEAWDDRERARVERLRAFVDALATDVDPASVGESWSAQATWCRRLVRRWLGDERRRESWPAFEQEAAHRVDAALDRLAGLDTVEAAPSPAVFRRTLDLELTNVYERVGRLGEGVLVGPVAFALGVELDRVFVCGLAEGTFPAVPRDDPLLSDGERAALSGELKLRADRITDDHRALLAALAAATGERVLCVPRGDLRRSTEHVASRYVPPGIDTFEVASFAHGLASVAFPATAHEYDVRSVLAGAPPGTPAVQRAADLVDARRSREFTRFDGNLSHLRDRLAVVGPASERVVVSATRLETFVACPHAYFVKHLLHVYPVERPEDVIQLSPLDRGSLVHAVLDRFVKGGGRAADRADLRTIFDEECARVEARGLAGRRLLWDRDRRVLWAELDAWLDADTEYRAERDVETLATELAFDRLEVALSDGRVLRFRGAADRVDRATDGHLVVIDYKNGKPDSYRALGPDDPVLGGKRLQLPLYAYAARAAFGAPDAPVEAQYWFVGRGGDEHIGYAVDAAVDAAFDEAVRAIVDGIDAGCFPSVPEPPGPRVWVGCHYCDPDGLGTGDRWREWERKAAAPAMEPFTSLFEPNE